MRVKRTWLFALQMSAFDPKRTFAHVDIGFLWRTPMLAFS